MKYRLVIFLILILFAKGIHAFAQERIQLRQAALFYKADVEYGRSVAEGLGLDIKEVEKLAEMSEEERAKATS